MAIPSASRPRKPSDDLLFWYGVPGADEVGIYLFDGLALVMDELAQEVNERARTRVIDAQVLKVEMDLFLAVSRF